MLCNYAKAQEDLYIEEIAGKGLSGFSQTLCATDLLFAGCLITSGLTPKDSD